MTITKVTLRVQELVQVDKAIIESALSAAPGIEAVKVDYENNIVEFATAAQDDGAHTIHMLKKCGYEPIETISMHREL